MSTRAVVNFAYDGQADAKVYVHGDGYPDEKNGMLATLDAFFKAVERQTPDTRFNDPSYLAAKFVVFLAHRNARQYDYTTKKWKAKKRLDFISVGIVLKDPGDLAYTYMVECGTGFGARPTVTWQKAQLRA